MKVSIITVAHNSAQTIAHAMDSVLQQTYKDIEYIVVDGLSTDDTLSIVKQYEPKFNGRMKWLSEEDDGIYDAMNKGVHMATGDIVGILNSDDFFTNDTIVEEVVKHFTPDTDAIYGDVHFVKPENLQKCVRYYSGKIFRPWQLQLGFFPPHPSLYIRRDLFDENGYYDPSYRISGDYELILRQLKRGARMRYLHQDFVTMRIGGASTANWRSRLEAAKENLRACKQNGIMSNRVLISMKYPIKALSSLLIRH